MNLDRFYRWKNNGKRRLPACLKMKNRQHRQYL